MGIFKKMESYGIISTDKLQRRHYSLIARLAGRPEGACVCCLPQVQVFALTEFEVMDIGDGNLFNKGNPCRR